MTTFDYTRAVASADRQIARYGQTGAIRRKGAATGPKHNPTLGASVDHPARLVLLRYQTREIDGGRILASDRKALISPVGLTIAPTTSDVLVEADGTVWKVVDMDILRPADTTVLITLHVRK
jgi:hypothetical protein